MRKTARITWLLRLLSLGLLFHGVCSVNGTDGATSVSKNPDNVTLAVAQNALNTTMTVPILVTGSSNKPTARLDTVAPTTDAGKKDIPTQAPTSAQPAAVAVTLTVKGPPTSNPTVLLVPTQAPVAPGITAAPATNADPTTVKDTTTPKATPSVPSTTLPAPRSSSSGLLVGATNAATVEPPVTATPGKTSGTKASVVTPSKNTNVGTTQNAKVPTGAPPTSQRSVVDATVTAKTGQEGSQGGSGTDKMTVTDRNRGHAASTVTQPTGNMGPTSSPSTPAKAGPSAPVGTFTAKAGPTLTTSTPNPASGHGIPSTSMATATTTIPPATPKGYLYSVNKRPGYSPNKGHEYTVNKGLGDKEEKNLTQVCQRLLANFNEGNCTLMYHRENEKIQFDRVEINGKVETSLAAEYYSEIIKTPGDNKTLIAILASCGALLIMIVILAVCASHHRKPYNENQQHLTEELHTVENGYHDNPTLEVMEVQPEMQEKKMAMNGEFNDSWIVPIDNLLKEDIPDEEDTHL